MKTTLHTLDKLLSPARFNGRQTVEAAYWDAANRSPFETDGDKITFTDGFRALADKTQVHDRVQSGGIHRNRLTHSMEVSRVGRSLGTAVGARMIAYYTLHARPRGETVSQVTPTEIGNIVAAACLSHDIGNPPFGHDGEDAIAAFFRNHPLGKKAVSLAGPEVGAELCLHEGNAQGFRMLTRSMGWRAGQGGLDLTAATLGAFGKYPFPLQRGKKKYGLHRADLEVMRFAAEATGMIADGEGWKRHPFAWLMEAADDASYLVIDLEDAAWMGIISTDQLLDLYAPIIGKSEIDAARAQSHDNARIIQYCRSRMIKTLINACVGVYEDLADRIDDGTLGKTDFGSGIIAHTEHAEALEKIRSFSDKNIYHSPENDASRFRFRAAMTTALAGLVEELIDWMRAGDQPITERHPGLSRLPNAKLGAVVPQAGPEALPWLLDQVTLMSDRQVFDLSRHYAPDVDLLAS